MNFLKSLAFFAASFSGVSQASDWINIGPVQSGDVQAFVDYQVSYTPLPDVWEGREPQGPTSYLYEAKPLWVNVHRLGLNPSDRVFVQIVTYAASWYRGQRTNTQTISQANLEYAEPNRFTGQLAPVKLGYQYNDGYALSRTIPYQHDLVVWINGRLYKGENGQNIQITMPSPL